MGFFSKLSRAIAIIANGGSSVSMRTPRKTPASRSKTALRTPARSKGCDARSVIIHGLRDCSVVADFPAKTRDRTSASAVNNRKAVGRFGVTRSVESCLSASMPCPSFIRDSAANIFVSTVSIGSSTNITRAAPKRAMSDCIATDAAATSARSASGLNLGGI